MPRANVPVGVVALLLIRRVPETRVEIARQRWVFGVWDIVRPPMVWVRKEQAVARQPARASAVLVNRQRDLELVGGLARYVREDDRAVAQPADVGGLQPERRRLDRLEDALATADDDGHDPDAKFVDEVRAPERGCGAQELQP